MSPQTWHRVKKIYGEACEKPAGEREAYLQKEAGGDERVLSEALRLLRYEGDADSRLAPLRVPQGLLTAKRGTLLPGQVLADRYEVRRYIAQGGFGEVYEAEDRERGEAIAIKLLKPEFATAAFLPWLKREVQLARRIQHPNVCRVFEVVQTAEASFLTMELLPGETLAQFLKREGSLSERRALPILRQIVAALAAAHKSGVVHRDLKPGNIMIVPRIDGPARAVVTDFGMARQSLQDRSTTLAAAQSTTNTMAFGTPAYMAPEQISGRAVGPAADIYSLGVVIHEMVTGELPFAEQSPLALAVQKTGDTPPPATRFAPALRETWVKTIQRCLDPRPERRFANAADVLENLQTRSRTSLYGKMSRRWMTRNLGTPGRIAAGCAIAFLAFGWWGWRSFPFEPDAIAQSAFEQAEFALQSGEPAESIRQFDAAENAGHRLTKRAHADLALAWHELGVMNRAKDEIDTASSILNREPDGAYIAAVRRFLSGDASSGVALLEQRAKQSGPTAALAAADHALLASILSRKPSAAWRNVIKLRPDHAAAHMQAAMLAATQGAWTEAEREFLAAETYFRTHANHAMAKAVSARRGLARLAAGNFDAARTDLLPAGISAIAASNPGAGPCERVITMMSGSDDDFGGAPDPIPYRSPNFGNDRSAQFDTRNRDLGVNVSFPLPPVRICSGQLHLRMRRDPEDEGTNGDAIQVGAAPFHKSPFPPLQRNLWAPFPGARDTVVTLDIGAETFANVEVTYAGMPMASLDVYAGEDTDFDYFKLILFY